MQRLDTSMIVSKDSFVVGPCFWHVSHLVWKIGLSQKIWFLLWLIDSKFALFFVEEGAACCLPSVCLFIVIEMRSSCNFSDYLLRRETCSSHEVWFEQWSLAGNFFINFLVFSGKKRPCLAAWDSEFMHWWDIYSP